MQSIYIRVDFHQEGQKSAYFADYCALLVEMRPAEDKDLNNPKITWHLSKYFLFATNPPTFQRLDPKLIGTLKTPV